MWPFKRKTETRSASSAGYTAQMVQARSAYITGVDGAAELTATVQAATSLWENGLSVADVDGTSLLSKRALAMTGLDMVTSVSGAATALANVGPGLGDIIGPAGNFQSLNDSAKWILSIAMLTGRLELLSVYAILTVRFWRA